MERIRVAVKGRRKYDSSRRREQAQRSQELILEAARRRFLADGYANTTVVAIAGDAAVSVETIYKAFAGKPGLVRALWLEGLDGRGPIPAPVRSDEMSAAQIDPAEIIRGWGRLSMEVAPEVAPVMLLMRAAANADPAMSALLHEASQQRWERMRHNAQRLAAAGGIRPEVSLDEATDLMWTVTSAELYELLVLDRKWTVERYSRFVADTIAANLLP